MKKTSLFWGLLTFMVLFSCTESNKKNRIVIGVNQYTSHPLLNEVYRGFSETIKQDSSFFINFKNANGDNSTLNLINNQFVHENVAVIVALGTPVAQSAVEKTKGSKIPVVFGGITDPVGAGLADNLLKPGGNKTGTTDMWPFEKQVLLVKELFPNAKKVGIVVNSGESNSVTGVVLMKKYFLKYNLSFKEVEAARANDVNMAASILAKDCDVIMVTPSNTVISGIAGLIKAANDANIPLIGGDKSTVAMGAIATYCFDYYDIGVATAKMTIKVLKEHKNAGEYSIEQPEKTILYANKMKLQHFNIVLPDTSLVSFTDLN